MTCLSFFWKEVGKLRCASVACRTTTHHFRACVWQESQNITLRLLMPLMCPVERHYEELTHYPCFLSFQEYMFISSRHPTDILSSQATLASSRRSTTTATARLLSSLTEGKLTSSLTRHDLSQLLTVSSQDQQDRCHLPPLQRPAR